MKIVKTAFEFEWDEGNQEKPSKHGLTPEETEEVFFDENKVTFTDKIHSLNEERLRIIGKTKKNKLLFVVFTRRGKKIRIISARDINRKEVSLYEKST